ncbi:MAG: glucose-6-phosphate dehydrogenase (coenzyme-F420) [Chloroflexota bacterium]
MIKIGYKASAEQFGPNDLLDFAVLAEENGFDSVMVSDHFSPWRHTDGHSPFSFGWMAAAGQRTKRVTIGASVVTPTFRYHPSIVAQAMGTLGAMTPNRVMLGIGTGEGMNEVTATGIEWPESPERFARLRESITLMRKLWTEELVTFEGQYYKTQKATVYDRPDKPVPIYVAASGPAAAKLAGRVADGFICTSGKAWELYREKLVPAVNEGEQLAGRPAGSVERMIEIKVAYDKDRDQAMKDTKIWAALALPGEAKIGIDNPKDMEEASKQAEPYAHTRWIVSNDPDEVAEKVQPYLDMGFTHLVMHGPGDDQARFIKDFAKDVMPKLRK